MMENQQHPSARPEPDENSPARKVELLISNLLRIGVCTSLLVVVIGTVISFIHHEDYFSQHPPLDHLTKPPVSFPHTLRGVWAGVITLRGQSIVLCGLLLLIATPVMRVAVSILGFIYEKDRRYIIITSIVLLLLILSFLVGKE